MRKITILLVMLGLFIVNSVYAGSIKEEYELQERCKNSADNWFQKEWGGQHISNDDKMSTMADYKCHYNKKPNKCFILLTTTTIPKNKKDSIVRTSVLFDINENKEYGACTIVQNQDYLDAYVLETKCSSKASWDLLVKPYMEE